MWLCGRSCFSCTNPSHFWRPLQSLLLRYLAEIHGLFHGLSGPANKASYLRVYRKLIMWHTITKGLFTSTRTSSVAKSWEVLLYLILFLSLFTIGKAPLSISNSYPLLSYAPLSTRSLPVNALLPISKAEEISDRREVLSLDVLAKSLASFYVLRRAAVGNF